MVPGLFDGECGVCTKIGPTHRARFDTWRPFASRVAVEIYNVAETSAAWMITVQDYVS